MSVHIQRTSASGKALYARRKLRKSDDMEPMIGRCLSCGDRLTFSAATFTLDVTCYKCFKINHFVESRHPVSCTDVADMDSHVVNGDANG